jgi:nucleotide-binding universal stress UspA family protein
MTTLARPRPAPAAVTGSEPSRPIVAGVDGSRADGAATEAAIELAAKLGAPLVFAHVRRPPRSFLGAPSYQRRLTRDMARARTVLERALAAARAAGIYAESEILEGSPRRRLTELAHDRDARLLVVGSRRRKLGRGVSRAVVRTAGRPVVVAGDELRLALSA